MDSPLGEGVQRAAWDEEVGSEGTKGPASPISSPVIKSSQCEQERHSPAAPSGRKKRGFHGYHLEEGNIQIKPESKVRPVSASLGLVCGAQGAEVHQGPAAPLGRGGQGGGQGTAGGPECGTCPRSQLLPLCPDLLASGPPEGREGSGCTLGV